MRHSSTLQPGFFDHETRVASHRREGPGSLISTFLLAFILAAGPLLLGAGRLWVDLPLLTGLALLLIIQGIRLATPPGGISLRQIDAIDLSVLFFVAYALARWLTSPSEYYSRIEVMNIIGYSVIFFFGRYGMAHRVYGLALVILLVLLGVGETIFGYCLSHHSNLQDPQSLWFPFGPTERLHIYFAPRWLGTYACPNHYASLLVMATGAALSLGAFSKFPWPLRIVLFYVAALLTVGILYSMSRGSWLSLIGAILALTIFGVRYGTLRWWIPVTCAVLIIAAFASIFALSPLVQRRVAEVTNDIQTGTLDSYNRIELAHDALRISHDYPLFGSGPATFGYVHPRYQSSTLAVRAVLTHEDYLNCLDDYGLVGFGLAMIFVWLVTLTLFSRVRADFHWMDRVLTATGATAWCALLVHSFFDFNLHIPANAMMLFALTGLGLRRPAREAAPRHWSTFSLAPLGRWLGWGLVVIGLLYGFETARSAISDIVYERTYADAETAPLARSMQGTEQALTFDSGNQQALDLLGDLYRLRAFRAETMEDRIADGQKALAAYQLALKANQFDDMVRAQLGLTFDIMGRYSEAFFCFKEAVTYQPYNGQFWNALGDHFRHRGLWLEAEESYLIAARCPHGGEGDADKAAKVQTILDAQEIAPPIPGTSPFLPQPERSETPTTP
jgi:hypothetical protein